MDLLEKKITFTFNAFLGAWQFAIFSLKPVDPEIESGIDKAFESGIDKVFESGIDKAFLGDDVETKTLVMVLNTEEIKNTFEAFKYVIENLKDKGEEMFFNLINIFRNEIPPFYIPFEDADFVIDLSLSSGEFLRDGEPVVDSSLNNVLELYLENSKYDENGLIVRFLKGIINGGVEKGIKDDDIAFRPADKYNKEGYYYNKLTGKKVEKF